MIFLGQDTEGGREWYMARNKFHICPYSVAVKNGRKRERVCTHSNIPRRAVPPGHACQLEIVLNEKNIFELFLASEFNISAGTTLSS
jgi:hypothetical protein